MSWKIRQSLNFYTDEFRPPRLPAEVATLQRQLLIIALLAGLAAVGLYGVGLVQEQVLQNLSQQEQLLTAAIAEEQSKRPPLVASPLLLARLQDAKDKLENSQKVLTYLSREGVAERSSLTPQVRELSAVAVPGVWLSGFTLADNGYATQLRGNAREAAQVSAYVAALAQQPAYSQVAFRQIGIKEDEGRNWLTFMLDTRAADAALAKNGGGQ